MCGPSTGHSGCWAHECYVRTPKPRCHPANRGLDIAHMKCKDTRRIVNINININILMYYHRRFLSLYEWMQVDGTFCGLNTDRGSRITVLLLVFIIVVSILYHHLRFRIVCKQSNIFIVFVEIIIMQQVNALVSICTHGHCVFLLFKPIFDAWVLCLFVAHPGLDNYLYWLGYIEEESLSVFLFPFFHFTIDGF